MSTARKSQCFTDTKLRNWNFLDHLFQSGRGVLKCVFKNSVISDPSTYPLWIHLISICLLLIYALGSQIPPSCTSYRNYRNTRTRRWPEDLDCQVQRCLFLFISFFIVSILLKRHWNNSAFSFAMKHFNLSPLQMLESSVIRNCGFLLNFSFYSADSKRLGTSLTNYQKTLLPLLYISDKSLWKRIL